MAGVGDVMTQDGRVAAAPPPCACAPRWPRCPRRSTTRCRPSGADDVRVGTRVRVPAPRAHGAGLGGRGRRRPRRPASTSCRSSRGSGWGPPPALVELAEWAAWRWAGPASFFLRVASPATVVRAAARHRRPPVAATGGTSGGAAALRSRLATWPRRRRAPPWCASRRPPISSTSCSPSSTTRPCAPGAAASLVLVPSTGWAERLTARLRAAGLPGHGHVGGGAGGVAGGGREPGRRPGRPVPRLAAAVVLDAHDAAYREESAPTYSAVEVLLERARREGEPLHPRVTGPAGRRSPRTPGLRRVARRPVRSGPAGRRSSGWTAAARTRGRGMFSEEFVRLARAVLDDPERGGPRARWSASTTARAAPACWPAGTAASWRAVPAAARRPPGRADEEVLRVPALRRDAAGRLRGLRTAAHEDAAGRREPAARGAGGAPRGRGGRGGRPAAAGGAGAAVPPAPGARRHRGGAAPGPPRRRGGLPRHRSAPAGPAALGDRGDAGALGPGRPAGRGRGSGPPWARVQVQTRVPDHPVLQAVARGEPDAGAGRGGGDAPRLGAATLLRAGAAVGCAGPGLRRGAAPGRRRPSSGRDGGRRCRSLDDGRVPAAGSRRTARCATCWPGRRGRPGAGCGSRSIPRPL